MYLHNFILYLLFYISLYMIGVYDTKWLYIFQIMFMTVFAFKNHGKYFAEKSTGFQELTDFRLAGKQVQKVGASMETNKITMATSLHISTI